MSAKAHLCTHGTVTTQRDECAHCTQASAAAWCPAVSLGGGGALTQSACCACVASLLLVVNTNKRPTKHQPLLPCVDACEQLPFFVTRLTLCTTHSHVRPYLVRGRIQSRVALPGRRLARPAPAMPASAAPATLPATHQLPPRTTWRCSAQRACRSGAQLQAALLPRSGAVRALGKATRSAGAGAGLPPRRSEAHAHRFRALVCCSGAAAEARVPEVRFPSPKRRAAAAAAGRASSRADKVARAVAWPRRPRHAPPAAPRRQAVRTHVAHRSRRGQSGEWPEAGFVAAVRAALPAHGACGAEAARVLYADGHAFLDVRSSMELDTEGKLLPQLPGVAHAPFSTFAKRIDAATGRKCVDKMPNAGFLAAAARALPDKSRGVVVVCSGAPSQGILRADAAADALRAAGYARVVVLSRGYAVRSRRAPASSSNRSAHIAQTVTSALLHRAGLVAALHEQGRAACAGLPHRKRRHQHRAAWWRVVARIRCRGQKLGAALA